MSSPFRFYVEARPFEKSESGKPATMRIGGIVSTANRDQEGERLLRNALDFGPFERTGYFNDNHGKETIHVVGYPTAGAKWLNVGDSLPDGSGKKSKVAGWWVEGALVGERGREIWKIANDLKGTPRQLGFSVQGSTLERDPLDNRTVTKAVVKQIAITFCPVNSETELRILSKALSAGSAVANPGATPGGGFPLRREALDGKIKPGGNPNDLLIFHASPRKKKKARKGGLTPQEGHELLRSLYPNLPETAIGQAYRFAVALKSQMGVIR